MKAVFTGCPGVESVREPGLGAEGKGHVKTTANRRYGELQVN